jgi:hypothetical protein
MEKKVQIKIDPWPDHKKKKMLFVDLETYMSTKLSLSDLLNGTNSRRT